MARAQARPSQTASCFLTSGSQAVGGRPLRDLEASEARRSWSRAEEEASEASQGRQRKAAQSRGGGESFPGAPGAGEGCLSSGPRGRKANGPAARPGEPRPKALSLGRASPLG